MTKRHKLFEVADFPVGETRVIPIAGVPPKMSLLVVRTETGFKAYYNVCQHLPVPLDGGAMTALVKDHSFVCGSHGARFEFETGKCTFGPCLGDHLESLETAVEDGVLYAFSTAR